jgi:glutamate N-acetyltransferase/amino-acid N-acetyltransferase
MSDWQEIPGGVTAPRGYRAAGIAAGLNLQGFRSSINFVRCRRDRSWCFTTSHVRAAPVDYCRQHLQARASARAILCNAGQANAATG